MASHGQPPDRALAPSRSVRLAPGVANSSSAWLAPGAVRPAPLSLAPEPPNPVPVVYLATSLSYFVVRRMSNRAHSNTRPCPCISSSLFSYAWHVVRTSTTSVYPSARPSTPHLTPCTFAHVACAVRTRRHMSFTRLLARRVNCPHVVLRVISCARRAHLFACHAFCRASLIHFT